jgi:hypothetical protein
VVCSTTEDLGKRRVGAKGRIAEGKLSNIEEEEQKKKN